MAGRFENGPDVQQATTATMDATDRERFAACLKSIAEERSRDSFRVLFDFYAPRLKTYLMKTGASENESEELVQDVMTTVWRKAALYDPAKASASTWIFRIARNRSIDAHRKRNKPALDPEEPSLQPSALPLPDSELSQRETAESVRRELETLPEEQLKLIRAAFYDGLSHSEISTRFDLPLGTVKSRIRLAFGRLRKRLEGER